jgi:hypothetical protein
VFIPAFQKVINIVTNDLVVSRELSQTIQPQFVPLQQDEVDGNQNITLQRNFDLRDVPVQAEGIALRFGGWIYPVGDVAFAVRAG